MTGWLFDVLLALALPVLAWRTLAARDLFRAVVLFISFGLLVALSWVRLGAPDIALAEAAIGAGVTGALLLNTLGSLASGDRPDRESGGPAREPAEERRTRPWVRFVVAVPALAVGLALVWAVVTMPRSDGTLPALVGETPSGSGVSNPVTAVLLDYRSYDTFLEVGVVLLAVVGVWSLGVGRRQTGQSDPHPGGSLLLAALARLLAPVMVLVGVYLLYAGTSAPGGAFQAGAVLGALGILLLLAGVVRPPLDRGAVLRVGLALGFGVFFAVTCVTLALGRLLEYPPGWEYALILLIEAVLTASIALTLVALFVTSPPEEGTE